MWTLKQRRRTGPQTRRRTSTAWSLSPSHCSVSVNSSVSDFDVASVVPISGLVWPGVRHSTLMCHRCPTSPQWSDFDLDSLFATSLRFPGDLLLLSPISSHVSPLSCASPDVPSQPVEASSSVDSGWESPATSMSITDRTGELQLMTPPLIPLPEMVTFQTDPALLMQ